MCGNARDDERREGSFWCLLAPCTSRNRRIRASAKSRFRRAFDTRPAPNARRHLRKIAPYLRDFAQKLFCLYLNFSRSHIAGRACRQKLQASPDRSSWRVAQPKNFAANSLAFFCVARRAGHPHCSYRLKKSPRNPPCRSYA